MNFTLLRASHLKYGIEYHKSFREKFEHIEDLYKYVFDNNYIDNTNDIHIQSGVVTKYDYTVNIDFEIYSRYYKIKYRYEHTYKYINCPNNMESTLDRFNEKHILKFKSIYRNEKINKLLVL